MGRFEKVLVLGVLLVAALSTFSFAQSTTENLVITTYYPSPAGSYRQLTVTDDNTAADRKALTVSQTGAVGGTGYAVYATKTGASTVNVGGYFSASGGTANYGLIVAAGSVGIGTTTPTSPLEVASAADPLVELNRTNGGGNGKIISFQRNGSEEGDISVTGANVSYNNFTGSHFGWSNVGNNFKRGEVLIATGDNKTNAGRQFAEGETIYGASTTDIPNDKRVLGVYAGIDNLNGDKWLLINAVGNGFILVTDSNGDIEVGDFLTSSSRSGYAQKQKEDVLKNYTIGKAMQSVRWADEKVDPELGFKCKLIDCTFKAG